LTVRAALLTAVGKARDLVVGRLAAGRTIAHARRPTADLALLRGLLDQRRRSAIVAEAGRFHFVVVVVVMPAALVVVVVVMPAALVVVVVIAPALVIVVVVAPALVPTLVIVIVVAVA